MGGSSKGTTTIENKDPWLHSQPHLIYGFENARALYDQQKASNDQWDGDFYAPVRDEQMAAYTGAVEFANNGGRDAAFQALNSGGALVDQGATGINNAMSGLYGLGNMDMTGHALSVADSYSKNPAISGMVDNAMLDARRQTSEQILPTIDRQAVATGNVNSTRKAISEGIVDRGLGEKAAGIRADLEGQAWQQGLAAAGADQNRRIQALQGAGSLASDAAKTGLYGLSSGVDMQGKNIETAIAAGTYLNAADQQALDNQLAKFEYSKQEPWDALNSYYAIMANGGTQGYSGTSVSRVKETPSAMSTAGSIAGIFSSLLKCDARTKENINELRTRPSGIKEYSFNYKGETESHTGPIAQQVREVAPDAVLDLGGTLHVDMRALRQFEEA